MKHYSKEFKDSLVKKMMPPNALSIAKIAESTGVNSSSLYNWRKSHRNQGVAVPADNSRPDTWSGEDKLAVVVETMALNTAELGEYCRSKGLYSEQILQWRQMALTGYKTTVQFSKERAEEHKKDQKKIKKLESELRRKEKALAETAALLVLSKKCQAIWGANEED